MDFYRDMKSGPYITIPNFIAFYNSFIFKSSAPTAEQGPNIMAHYSTHFQASQYLFGTGAFRFYKRREMDYNGPEFLA